MSCNLTMHPPNKRAVVASPLLPQVATNYLPPYHPTTLLYY